MNYGKRDNVIGKSQEFFFVFLMQHKIYVGKSHESASRLYFTSNGKILRNSMMYKVN